MNTDKQPSAIVITHRKKLAEAVEYLKTHWIPVNQDIQDSVLRLIDQQAPIPLIMDELEKDIGLYFWFLSRLEGGDGAFSSFSDLNLLSLENIGDIFDVARDGVSPHRFEHSLKMHQDCFKQSLISIAGTEVIAESLHASAREARLRAGVKALGINLISWNYPRIYEKAVTLVKKEGTDIDEILTRIMGFNPYELGVEITLKWVTNNELKQSILPQPKQEEEKSALREAIELGEALGKLSQPELYPVEAKDAKNILYSIENKTGSGGLERIQNQLKKSTRHYAGIITKIEELSIDPDRTLGSAAKIRAARLFSENTWAQKLPEQFREQLRSVYMELKADAFSPGALSRLSMETVKTLGFSRGCLYLIDESTLTLHPKLRFGNISLEKYRKLSKSDPGVSSHPAIESLSYSAPIVKENVAVDGEIVSLIAGKLGAGTKDAVLYLEMSDALSMAADRMEALVAFKAVRKAVIDCLSGAPGT